MLKKFTKTALTAASILIGAGAANASVNVTIQSNGFGTGAIEVISENGTSWTKVLPSSMTLPVSVEMGITSGKLVYYAILQNGTFIGSWNLFNDSPSSTQRTHTVTGSASNFSLETLTVLKLCNDKLNVGQGINQQHTSWFMVPLTLRAYFQMTNGDPYPPYEGYGTVPVRVHCKPHIPANNELVFDHGDMKVKNIKLFLTTYSNAFTRPNPATKCKKVKLLVRLKASKKGLVKFKLWKRAGNGAMTSKVINAWASHDGNGGFRAEHSEWISVNKTTFVQAKAEEMVNSVGLSTPWEDITLQCSHVGGGGLAGNPTPNNPDNDIPQGKNVDGNFAFVDRGSPKCKRTGKALITFRSPKPDNIHFSLDCKFDNHSGVVPTVPHPDGGYTAATLVSFDVDKTYTEACTLRTVAPYGPEDHVNKTHLFQCVTTSGHSASNDVQVDSNTPSNKPDAPAKLVVGTGTQNAPSAPWRCIGGTVQGRNGCVCPQHKKLIYTQVRNKGQLISGSKCVLSGPSDKTTKPVSTSTDTAGTVKADAVKRRLEAAKQAAIAKRKRAAAEAKTLKLKAAKSLARKAVIAKRKRDAAKMVAVKKAAAALRLRRVKAQKALVAKRATAAALARQKAIAAQALARRKALAVKKRAAPRRTSPALQRRAIRRP